MRVVLCKPTGSNFHDQEAFRVWLWINGVSAWTNINIVYNDVYDFYDIIVDIKEEWRKGLITTLKSINASHIENFDTPINGVRAPRIRFWVDVPKDERISLNGQY